MDVFGFQLISYGFLWISFEFLLIFVGFLHFALESTMI